MGARQLIASARHVQQLDNRAIPDGIDQICDGVDGVDSDGDGIASVSSGGTDHDE